MKLLIASRRAWASAFSNGFCACPVKILIAESMAYRTAFFTTVTT